METQKLRILYSDIIKGYSMINSAKFGAIYVKHPNHVDSATVDSKTEFYLEKAKSRNLPTLEEQEKYLEEEGLWNEKKDKEIRELSDYLKTLKTTKGKSMLKAEREQIQKTIDETELKVAQMQAEKAELIGFTAEAYANRKANEYYMFGSIYSSPACDKTFFSYEEFVELDEPDLNALVIEYNVSQSKFSGENIKRIAVSPFFINVFYLCDDRVWDFFGKPVIQLTFSQAELFSYGKFFKNILSEHRNKIPPHLLENPDGLIDWYERNKNAEKILQTNKHKDGSVSTIVGATKDDIKDLGFEGDVIDLSKEAAKKGGSLSMEDLIRLHKY